MDSFDDILNQPLEAVPPEPEQPPRKLEWWQVKEQKQRVEAFATLNGIFHAFSNGKGDVQGYLDIHSRFPFYSARNALLIRSKRPEATKIGSYSYWKERGVEVLKTEKRNPIIILEPGNKSYVREDGTIGKPFYAKEVYDISQTSAREQAQVPVTFDDRLILRALIHKPPVAIQVLEQLPEEGRGAMYDLEQKAILVKKGMDAPDIFRCVSLELAKVELNMVDGESSLARAGYKAYCVSYMLCKKYGIDTQGYNVQQINQGFKGQEIENIKADLTDMENVMAGINSRMAKVLFPKNKNLTR